MPARIDVVQRPIAHIRVAIQRLRIPCLRHDGIRAEEAAQRGRVESRAVIIQAPQRDALLPLPRVAAIRRHAAGDQPCLAEGSVPHLPDFVPAAIQYNTGTAQMVAHDEGQRRAFAHGYALRSGEIVRARHARADVLLVDRADIDRRLAVLHLLDAVAIAVVIIHYALAGGGSPFWDEQATTTDPESARLGISRSFMGLSQLRCHYATATPVYDNESSALSRYMPD